MKSRNPALDTFAPAPGMLRDNKAFQNKALLYLFLPFSPFHRVMRNMFILLGERLADA
jgi:hypothetical protein